MFHCLVDCFRYDNSSWLRCLTNGYPLVNWQGLISKISFPQLWMWFQLQFHSAHLLNSKSLKPVIFWWWSLKQRWWALVDDQLFLRPIILLFCEIRRKRERKRAVSVENSSSSKQLPRSSFTVSHRPPVPRSRTLPCSCLRVRAQAVPGHLEPAGKVRRSRSVPALVNLVCTDQSFWFCKTRN